MLRSVCKFASDLLRVTWAGSKAGGRGLCRILDMRGARGPKLKWEGAWLEE